MTENRFDSVSKLHKPKMALNQLTVAITFKHLYNNCNSRKNATNRFKTSFVLVNVVKKAVVAFSGWMYELRRRLSTIAVKSLKAKTIIISYGPPQWECFVALFWFPFLFVFISHNFWTLMWLCQHTTVTLPMLAVGYKIHTLLLSFPHLYFLFFSDKK